MRFSLLLLALIAAFPPYCALAQEDSNDRSTSRPLPDRLRAFVAATPWTFAKTYAKTWPHEYIVRGKVDESLFVELVRHIRKYGYEGRFYRKPITYFDEDGMVYWTMGDPIETTTIINRCTKEQSYEERIKERKKESPPAPRGEE